ncbi:hypothetical protein U27_06967 [Candidatus Vecturithrix granuli]|uniref:HNH nuclease domain-containing protein n=1 Tax=Vecturithrix granuli TaxID=1499967 RepID=A0A081C5X5_VECG1|nr:hypothetical protein U27_06967 [Candidatus Vecturithrix granuli]
MLQKIFPTLEWYTSKSQQLKTTPRCPIASHDLCPRYYASLCLLSLSGYTTRIADAEIQRLDKKWKDYTSLLSEDEATIFSDDHNQLTGVAKFCPEVTFMVFGIFASGLHEYTDSLHHEHVISQLTQMNVSDDDPRYAWGIIIPWHYTECSEYSVFSDLFIDPKKTPPAKTKTRREGMSKKLRWAVFARDDFTCQYCGRKPPDVILEADHKISVKNGGVTSLENLITSCETCNRGKGAKNHKQNSRKDRSEVEKNC